MNPFRATYTPIRYVEKRANGRSVLILAFLPEGEATLPQAIFIDSDLSLRSDTLNHFTNCYTRPEDLLKERNGKGDK